MIGSIWKLISQSKFTLGVLATLLVTQGVPWTYAQPANTAAGPHPWCMALQAAHVANDPLAASWSDKFLNALGKKFDLTGRNMRPVPELNSVVEGIANNSLDMAVVNRKTMASMVGADSGLAQAGDLVARLFRGRAHVVGQIEGGAGSDGYVLVVSPRFWEMGHRYQADIKQAAEDAAQATIGEKSR